MTIIEIRPFRNGWKCFEAPGIEPVFWLQEQAVDYVKNRACFRSGEIRLLASTGNVDCIVSSLHRRQGPAKTFGQETLHFHSIPGWPATAGEIELRNRFNNEN